MSGDHRSQYKNAAKQESKVDPRQLQGMPTCIPLADLQRYCELSRDGRNPDAGGVGGGVDASRRSQPVMFARFSVGDALLVYCVLECDSMHRDAYKSVWVPGASAH